MPEWVKHVGAAQESTMYSKINPGKDYTRNPEHPASQLRWVQVEANKDNKVDRQPLPQALCGRFVIFYCIDGYGRLTGNVDIGFMQVHGRPLKLNGSVQATSEADSASELLQLLKLTKELTKRAREESTVDSE